MKRILSGVLGACLVLVAALCPAAPVSLDGTEQWRMTSAEGRQYRIMISLPEGDVPHSGGYPVIYLLDGNAYFPTFHAAKRAQARFYGSILVAIGYPSDTPLDFTRRAFDLTPPAPAEHNTPPQGGRDLLLSFIETRLMPRVSQQFQVDPAQRSLVGHSFGGMWGIYALFARPTLFQQVVAVSPSLWWRGQHLLAPERAFTERARRERLDLTQTSLSIVMAERDSVQMIRDARSLHARLQALSDLGMRSGLVIEAGEDHTSVPFRIPNQVLGELLGNRR